MADEPANVPKATSHQPDELIVATSHLPVVAAALHDAGIRFDEERGSLLDLTRLRLDITAASPAMVRNWATAAGARADRAKMRTQTPSDALEGVLFELRDYFLALHAWSPTMGKNRNLTPVFGGGGAVSPGGEGDPTGAAAGSIDIPLVAPTGVTIGVLDTGIFPNPALEGRWRSRFSDVLRPPAGGARWTVADGHGTFVTGLLLQHAPGAMVEFRAALGTGQPENSWDFAEALVALGTSGVQVINLSCLCFTLDNQPPLVLTAAIDRLPPEVVVVAAAGNHGLAEAGDVGATNEGKIRPAFPAAQDSVLAVGAAVVGGGEAEFTPKKAAWIDLLAPGVNLRSTYLSGEVTLSKLRADETGDGVERSAEFSGAACWSGSSFASAVVSGLVASGTQPGRISARDSLDNILGSLAAREVRNDTMGSPPYVNVDIARCTEETS